jgi:hypothetical protein
VSNVHSEALTFFELYSRGDIPAERIDDFVSDWRASDDSEQRSLAAFLGLTDEEYDIWLMDPDTLPQILLARRTERRLKDVVADYVAAMRGAARPEDRSALYALGHWLGSHPDR